MEPHFKTKKAPSIIFGSPEVTGVQKQSQNYRRAQEGCDVRGAPSAARDMPGCTGVGAAAHRAVPGAEGGTSGTRPLWPQVSNEQPDRSKACHTKWH